MEAVVTEARTFNTPLEAGLRALFLLAAAPVGACGGGVELEPVAQFRGDAARTGVPRR